MLQSGSTELTPLKTLYKINTLHQITGGRVGDLPGDPRNVLLIDGEGGSAISDI